MNWLCILGGFFSLVLTGPLLAQTEPVDKNFGGPYAAANLNLGQAFKVGKSSPGPLWLVSGELGYGVKRDTWNRVEIGVELGKGEASFKDKNYGVDVDIDLDFVMMLKGAYGYSLGGPVFGFLRAGAGLVKASYDGRSAGAKVDGGSSTGLVSVLAWDLVYFASESLDLNLGVNYRFFNFNFRDLPGDAGSFQANAPSLAVGARLRL